MRFIVVTDSHFERPELMNLVQEVERRRDIDALFHLGDVEADAEYLRGRDWKSTRLNSSHSV